MKTKSSTKLGFTLVEMLFSVVLSAVVVAGILAAFTHQRRSYATISEVVSMQQNLRPALERLARELRMAGYGVNVPDSDIPQWFPWVASATSRVVITEGATANDPDELLVLGAFGAPESSVQMATAPGDTMIHLPPGENANFNTIDKRVILVGRQETARVVGISGNQLVISTDPTVVGEGLKYAHPSGAPVELVKAVSYRTGINTNEVPEMLYFMREENTSGLPPLADRLVAVHVEDFQLTMVSSNTLNVELTGRTQNEDEHYTHPTESDGYRRELVRTRVLLRNPLL